ncbi:PAS sensor protein [Nitrosococcus halophilus Nc 4]|uniref:histidine kinase n=1 Tax=Nitrosococcus halophilus (strain Nc4) TaxID=472759 RepID=D5C2H2_NITHN|nr:ATP-binding protein [Nitrosococcus halophilus]ADE14831.1 PAS sensor protein [Nitrosococcus halophilus Nc 4]
MLHSPSGIGEQLQQPGTAEFQHLLEKLPAGAYMCDPNGLITYFNQRAVELWGRAPKLNDAEDRFCGSFKLFSPDGSPIHHNQCWMALALYTEREYNGREIIIERPNGHRLTVEAHANPIYDEVGTLLGAVNVLVDITARKQAEEKQRQMQAKLAHMERLSLAGGMAAGLAHELNQPLAAIVSYSEACLNLLHSGKAGTPKLIKIMERIVEQGQRAGKITHRLKDLTGKTTRQRIPVNLNVLIGETINLIEAKIRERKVKLRLDLADWLPPVEANPLQLQQVLVNLIQNSLEAMSDIEAHQRRLFIGTAHTASGAIEVAVRDSGPGLTREILEQLFQPFVTTKPYGMGLGLSISKSIIEAHGGQLWIISNPGKGGTFHFTLPRQPFT